MEEDSPERALVLSRLAMSQQFRRPTDEFLPFLDEALAIARRLGNADMLVEMLYFSHFVRLGRPDYADERATLCSELASTAKLSPNPFHTYQAISSRSFDLVELGDLAGAEAHAESRMRIAEAARLPWSMALSAEAMVVRPLAEGRFEEAERRWQRLVELAQRTQMDLSQSYGAQLLGIRHLQGRLAELEPLVKGLIERFHGINSYRSVLAWVYIETGRDDLARAEFERLATDDFASLQGDATWMTSLYLLSEVCAVLGDERRAALLYESLRPFEGGGLVVTPVILYLGAASRSLGMMASVMRRWDDAERHFEDALAFDGRTGARPWLAHTQYNYAKMLLARDAPGDKTKALSLLQQALDTAQELGMKRIVELSLALKLEAQGFDTSTDVMTSIDAVARAVQRERPNITVHAAPDGTVTIMFSDIEDSTPLAGRLGDLRWQELLRAHNAIIREQIRAHAGFEVKTMGDGFMVAFQSARRALECAIAIQRALGAGATGGSPLPEPVRVRIGMHSGEAVKDEDDFYGNNVILASRIAAQAAGGEVLVSALLKQLVDTAGGFAFGDGREVELKGVAERQRIFAVRWDAE
jgi:class 3 adenylate cyclase